MFPNLFKEHDQMELYADIIGKVLPFSAIEKYINPLMPGVSFYTPWKHRKGFPIFSRRIEIDQWHEMG